MTAAAQRREAGSAANCTVDNAAKKHVYDADGFDENGLDVNGFTRDEVKELLRRIADLEAGNGKEHELLEPNYALESKHVYDAEGYDENGLDRNGFMRGEVEELLRREAAVKAGHYVVHELLEPIH